MNINLVVIKGKIVLASGDINLEKIYILHGENHRVKKLNGRLDFYHLGNTVSVTRHGFITIYISVNINITVQELETILTRIADFFNPYTNGIQEITYKAANIQLSGKASYKGSLLLTKLRSILQTTTDIIEIVIGSDINVARISNASALPLDNFLYIYIEAKCLQGKFKIQHTGYYTIITTKFKYIPFWELFCTELTDGISAKSSV